MKKKRILLGLLVAAGAAFSLSSLTSCVKDNKTPEVVTEKYTVTFNTNGGSAVDNQTVEEGKKATKPADPTKAATATATYAFAGWFKDSALTQSFDFDAETITANTTIYAKWTETAIAPDKLTVKFMDGTTELTALKQELDENQKATKPETIPTKDGKRFVYWADDEALETAYNFDNPVISNVTLYAIYKDVTDYDTMKASDKNIFATDFSKLESAVTMPESGASLTIDNKLKLETANVSIGHATITDAGFYEVFFEVSPIQVTNKEAWFQIEGTSAEKATKTEVFGIRAFKPSTDLCFAYRLDGGADQSSTVKFEANKTYKVKVTIDTAEGKASYAVNGTTVVENISINITSISGVKFTCKNTGASNKIIDDVAINFTAKTVDPTVAARAAVVKKINDYKATEAYTGLATPIKNYFEVQIADIIADLADADTTEIATLSATVDSYIAATKGVATINAYTAASTPLANSQSFVVFIGTLNAEDVATQYNNIKFAGYTIDGLYKDEALTEAAAPADVVSGATLYAKVTKGTVAATWSAGDLTVTEADADKAIAAGTELTSIVKTAGDVKLKLNGDKDACIGFNVKQNGAGSLVVEVPTGYNVTVTFLLRSTSSSNTSDGIALYNGDTVVVPTSFTANSDSTTTNTDGVIVVKGTEDATVVYTLAAGTYVLKNNASTTNNREFRVYGITVAENNA